MILLFVTDWGTVGVIAATILAATIPQYFINRNRHQQNIRTWNRIVDVFNQHGLHSHRECDDAKFGDKVPLTTDGIIRSIRFLRKDKAEENSR